MTPDTRDDAFAKGMRMAFIGAITFILSLIAVAALGGWVAHIMECCK